MDDVSHNAQHLSRNATVIPADGLQPMLQRAADEGRQLRIKLGIDPTGADLHLGHLVILRKMREWQDMGHLAVLIVGDATARVGDPTGRSTTRPPMSEEAIEANTVALLEQLSRVLDPQRLELRRNADWLNMPSFDLFQLLARTTLAQVMEREDIRSRHQEGKPVSMLETVYPLLQGFDSVQVQADVELGGQDQLINLMVGRDLQREHGQTPQIAMTMGILVGIDGQEKMSKSLDNHLSLLGDPADNFGRAMSLPDHAMSNWGSLLGIQLPDAHPRDQKRHLARQVVAMTAGDAAAVLAQADFDRKFIERGVPEDLKEHVIADETQLPLVLESAFGITRSEARRLIQAGAVRIDGEVTREMTHPSLPGHVLQAGKKRFVRCV